MWRLVEWPVSPIPMPSAAQVDGEFRREISHSLIRRCVNGQPMVAFAGSVKSEVEPKKLKLHGCSEALRDAFETSQGSRGGGVQGHAIGQAATVSDFLFVREAASLLSLIASSIDCCELGCALLVPTSRGYVWSDKSVMPPDEEAFE